MMLNPVFRRELERIIREGSTPEMRTIAGLILRAEENHDELQDLFDNHTHDANGDVYRRR